MVMSRRNNKIYKWSSIPLLSLEEKEKIRFIGGSPLIIGGSYNNYSPPIISSSSAYISGTEKIYLMVPSKISDLARQNTDFIIYALPDQKITRGVAKKIIKLVEKKKVSPSSILIGSGVTGVWKEVGFLIDKLSKEHNYPIVVDRDAVKNDVISFLRNLDNLLLLINNRILLNIFNRKYGSRKELYDIIKDIANDYSIQIVYLDNNALVSSNGSENFAVEPPESFKLKYNDPYVLSGLITGISSKSISLYESSILSIKIFVKTFIYIYENIGISYSSSDLLTYLKQSFKDYF